MVNIDGFESKIKGLPWLMTRCSKNLLRLMVEIHSDLESRGAEKLPFGKGNQGFYGYKARH